MLTLEQRTQLERAGLALVGVLLLVVGYAAGRYSAPLQVETREVEKLVYRDLTVEDLTKGMTFARQVELTRWRNVVTTITVTPDAGTVTVIADNTIEREGSQESTSSTETSRRTEEHAGERTTEKTVITTLRPSWSLGVLVGATWLEPALPIAGPLVLGATADVRLGQTPFSLGAWGTTQGAFGVIGRGEF